MIRCSRVNRPTGKSRVIAPLLTLAVLVGLMLGTTHAATARSVITRPAVVTAVTNVDTTFPVNVSGFDMTAFKPQPFICNVFFPNKYYAPYAGRPMWGIIHVIRSDFPWISPSTDGCRKVNHIKGNTNPALLSIGYANFGGGGTLVPVHAYYIMCWTLGPNYNNWPYWDYLYISASDGTKYFAMYPDANVQENTTQIVGPC